MKQDQEAKKIIQELNESNIHAECSCCEDDFALKDAELFYLDNFSDRAGELYKEQLAEVKARRKELNEKKKNIPKESEIKATATNIGTLVEKIVPSMKSFESDPNDCRALFEPIDYIIFDGLSKKGIVSRIIFNDIKTGNARLTGSQKEIKALIENKKVEWDTYSTKERK